MRKVLFIAIALALQRQGFSQGTVVFTNRGGTSTTNAPGQVFAPIYREDPIDPSHRISGNTPTGIPPGNTSYNGAAFAATGQGPTFTVTLWGLNSTVVTGDAAENNLQPLVNGTTVMRTSTSGTFAGIMVQPNNAAVVPGVNLDTDRATVQVRIWDTRGGTITNWDQVKAQQNNDVLRGYSEMFTVPYPLGGTTTPPTNAIPYLQGLQSFNVFTANFYAIVTIQGEGTVTKSPAKQFYSLGEQVTLAAAPARWFSFTGWGDGPTANPRVITIGPSSNTYSAIFSATTAVETVTFNNVRRVAPVGMPIIFVDGEFIVTNAVSRVAHATIEMQTTFTNGTIFFTLDGSEPGPFSDVYVDPFAIKRTRTIRAIAYDADFSHSSQLDPITVEIIPTFALIASTSGGGSITVSPNNAEFPSNTLATVSANPTGGWSFLQWLGDAQGTNSTVTLIMTRNRCVEAVFGTALTTTATGNGSIEVEAPSDRYPFGWNVRLTAIPQAGNAFAVWGSGRGTNNPIEVQVTNANANVSALFGSSPAGQYSVTVRSSGRGHTTSMPKANRYTNGQTVTITAIPNVDQEFLGWSGQITGTQNPLSLVVSRDTLFSAIFTRRPQLSVWDCAPRETGGPLHSLLSADLGDRLELQGSSNLLDWVSGETVTNTFGRLQFDTPATNSHGFRRALLLP